MIYNSLFYVLLDYLALGNGDDGDDGFIFIMSVDGTHCQHIEEPRPFST
jgi:hypothetical protein